MISAREHKNIAIREALAAQFPLADQFRDTEGDALGLGLLIVISGHDHRRAVWQGWPELLFKAGCDIVARNQVIRGLQDLRRRAIVLFDGVNFPLWIHSAKREDRRFRAGSAKLINGLVGIAHNDNVMFRRG